MKTVSWIFGTLVVLTLLLAVAGCSLNVHTEWGEPAPIGNGEAQSFVMRNDAGMPLAVGVNLTADALTGLPGEGIQTRIDLPASIATTPIDHLVLDWNPMGHIPPGIYDLPHFDFHFYLIGEAERAAITPGTCTTAEESRVPSPPGTVPVTCEVFDRAMQPLPAAMMPANYRLVPAVVPNMGNHLLDGTAPELNDESFTYTWIYGHYDGKITFLEPMITKAFFESNNNICAQITTPQVMPQAGWYPTQYCIKQVQRSGAYTITLESFKWFEAASSSPEPI